jgi:hypothetical protein
MCHTYCRFALATTELTKALLDSHIKTSKDLPRCAKHLQSGQYIQDRLYMCQGIQQKNEAHGRGTLRASCVPSPFSLLRFLDPKRHTCRVLVEICTVDWCGLHHAASEFQRSFHPWLLKGLTYWIPPVRTNSLTKYSYTLQSLSHYLLSEPVLDWFPFSSGHSTTFSLGHLPHKSVMGSL